MVDASLIVIAYNERAHAPETVRSVLDQKTDATFDLIVVDDGSTDNTAQAATAAAGGDPRFRLVTLQANQGRGAARAAGVKVALGSVIGFVDADIELPADWLARCLAALPGNAAVSGIAVPDGDTAVVARISGATVRPVPGSMPITGNNVLFDRAALEATGFDPRDRLGEDFRLAHRMVAAGYRLHRVPGLMVQHHERKSYRAALLWRFANGIDAATHPREFGVIRFADVVWAGWLASWGIAVVGSTTANPWWLLLGVAASVGVGILHAATRFVPSPLGAFLLACIADIPMLNAYMLGRTFGIPRLVMDRR